MSKKYFKELLRQHEYLRTLSRSDSIHTYASKQVEDHDLQDFMALYKQAGFWSFLKDLAHSTAVNLQIFDTVAENIADELEENNYDGARKILLEATNKLIEDQEITKKLKAIPNEQITSEVISKMATDMTNGIVAKLNKSVKAELTGSGMMLDPDGLASLIFEALGGNEEGKQASSQFNLIKQADVGDIATGSASTIAALMSWNIGKKVVKATPEAIKKATELFQQAVKSLGSKATDTAYRDALYKSIRQALVEGGVPEPARVAKLTADKLAAEAVKRPQAANLIKNILTKIVKAPAGVATQAVKTAYEKLIKSPKLVGLAKKLGPKWPKIATAIASKLGPRLGALTAAGGIPYVGQIIAALGIADMIGNEVSMGEGVPEAEWNRIFDRGAIRAQIFAQLSAVATQMTGKTYEDKGQTTQEGKATPEQKDQFYTYKVQKGDSLSGIAAKELGNQNLWKKIHELNPQIQDPNKIFEGQELKLPGKGSVTLKAQPPKAPAKPDKPKSLPKAPAKPAQQPGTAPAQQPGTAPAQQPGTAPAQQPGTAPAQQPGTAPAQQPGTAPAQQPGAAPAPTSRPKSPQEQAEQLKQDLDQNIQIYTTERELQPNSDEGNKAAAAIAGQISKASASGSLGNYATILNSINLQEGNAQPILANLDQEGIVESLSLPTLIRAYTRRPFARQDIRDLQRVEDAFRGANLFNKYKDTLLALRRLVIRKAKNAGEIER